VASGDVGKGKRKEAPTPEQAFLLIIYSNSLTRTKFARSTEKVQVKGARCRGDSGRLQATGPDSSPRRGPD
jgi:hypothetical protein